MSLNKEVEKDFRHDSAVKKNIVFNYASGSGLNIIFLSSIIQSRASWVAVCSLFKLCITSYIYLHDIIMFKL